MGTSDDRASIIRGDALNKVLPDLDIDEDDSNVDESKVPLTRSNVYADSPREVFLSNGISEDEVLMRKRVGIAFVLGLVLASAICVMLLGVYLFVFQLDTSHSTSLYRCNISRWIQEESRVLHRCTNHLDVLLGLLILKHVISIPGRSPHWQPWRLRDGTVHPLKCHRLWV